MQDLIKIVAMGKTFCRHKIEVSSSWLQFVTHKLTVNFNHLSQSWLIHWITCRSITARRYSEPYRAASTPYSLEKLTWVTFYNPTQLDPPDTDPRIDPTTITACTLVQAVAQCNRIGRISNRANTTHEALQPTRPIPRERSVTEDLISTVIVGTDFSLFLWVPVPFLTLVPFSLLLPLPSASLPMPFTVGHSVEALLSLDLRLKRICVFSESKIFFKWRKRLWIYFIGPINVRGLARSFAIEM